ncbi:Lar family restriction alleviation protein [Noviherbaspirillum sp. 1P10PC]|uniref:Lar family restriction alleviation protein n=1 Tax=Noviherbaspirillum sp. 1P10PC TaxID=3132292 RepID=UPI0039A1C6E4
MIDQLHPCPFCGGSAGIKTASSLFGNEWARLGYFIECSGCGSRSKTVEHWGTQWASCLDMLAAHWNCRASSVPISSERLAGPVAPIATVNPPTSPVP